MAENSQDLGYYLSCQLCFVTLRDAVSLECNHSFCKTCVCTFWDQDENRKCPVCQMPASKDEPQVNMTLKELADVFAGRIPDPNVEKKKKKKEEDYRFCTSHVVKPSWFCVNDNRLICEGCESVKKHVQHKLMRLKEVVAEMKESVSQDLDQMKQQLQDCSEAEKTYLLMERHSAAQRVVAEKKIKGEFAQLHQFLREEEEARLTAIRKEAERAWIITERELKIIRGQMHVLTESISRLEKDMKKDDYAFFKDSDNIKKRANSTLQDPQVVSGLLTDVANHTGNLKFNVWKKMMDLITYYPVMLDPNTADGWLSVSEDMVSVKEIRDKQVVPDNPERFTRYIYVLGSEGYTSGKHCWEVDVGNRNRWSLGIAKEFVERKEETFLEPKFGFWTLWMTEYKCTVGGEIMGLENRPKKVRIQLDYEKGELSFYDAVEITHIYTYKTKFKDKLYPFFSTETDESKTTIQLCPFKLSWIATPQS